MIHQIVGDKFGKKTQNTQLHCVMLVLLSHPRKSEHVDSEVNFACLKVVFG